jgi:putative transposase
MVSTCARRAQVLLAEGKGLSRRRACALLDVSRSCLGYVSRRDVRDRPVIEQMQKLAGQYPRYGYRRIRIFLRRAGVSLSMGRTLNRPGFSRHPVASQSRHDGGVYGREEVGSSLH